MASMIRKDLLSTNSIRGIGAPITLRIPISFVLFRILSETRVYNPIMDKTVATMARKIYNCLMLSVKIITKHMIEIGHNTNGKRHSQSQNINECKYSVFIKVTEGNQKVIS